MLTYLKERIKEVLTGAGATIVVRIFGPDMDVLRAKAQEVDKVMEASTGVTNLKVEPQVLVPQLDVRLRPEAAARLGLTAGDVRRAATTLVKGTKVGELYREQKIFDVFVWGTEEVRNDVSKLSTPADRDPAGDARAARRRRPTSRSCRRPTRSSARGPRGGSTSPATSRGRDLGSVAREIEEKVKALDFDREYHPEFLGEYAAREESQQPAAGPGGPLARWASC